MKKPNHKLIIGSGIVALFCFLLLGLYFALIWQYFPPNWVIVWQNKARASRYRSAAEQGDAEAQRELGGCYFRGVGVPLDQVEAVKWFHKAAQQGDTDAQSRLAYCYDNGKGVPEDKEEAVRRYRIAAEHGNIQGQWKLGVFHLTGVGVSKDEAEAVKWFRKAAEQDYYYAQYLLGRCYFEGTGVTKDDAEAAKWLRKISWLKDAAAILKEIDSDSPRPPNPHWGEEVWRGTPTPPVKH